MLWLYNSHIYYQYITIYKNFWFIKNWSNCIRNPFLQYMDTDKYIAWYMYTIERWNERKIIEYKTYNLTIFSVINALYNSRNKNSYLFYSSHYTIFLKCLMQDICANSIKLSKKFYIIYTEHNIVILCYFVYT